MVGFIPGKVVIANNAIIPKESVELLFKIYQIYKCSTDRISLE